MWAGVEMVTRIMIMAGGTGGHVFPALAVAEELRAEGADVLWVGTRQGLESDIVPRAGFPLATITIAGLRGKGAGGWLMLPLRMLRAMWQSLLIIMRFRPMAVLGMGGFVTGPGGLTTWLLRKPLLIHEQNAVAGLTNRWLARVADKVMVAFPGALPPGRRPVLTGNPVRMQITALAPPAQRFEGRGGALHVLVLGGSQGARALNESVPAAVSRLDPQARPLVWHQSGGADAAAVRAQYCQAGIQSARVDPFIDDMAGAYEWADVVICRAGALTVAELTAAGLGAVLIPLPHAADGHQTRNALYLVEAGAGVLVQQDADMVGRLNALLAELNSGAKGAPERQRLLRMAEAARRLARPEAARAITRLCMEEAARG